MRNKLTILYIVAAILPLILTNTLMYNVATQTIISKTDSLVYQNTYSHSALIEERIDNYKLLLLDIIADKEFIELCDRLSYDDTDKAIIKLELENILRSYAYGRELLYEISFLSNSDYIVHSTKSEYSLISSADRAAILSNSLATEDIFELTTLNIDNKECPVFYIEVNALLKNNTEGILIMLLTENLFQPFENNTMPTFSENNELNGVYTNIVDEQSKILYCENQGFVKEMQNNFLDNTEGNKHFIHAQINQTPWTIITTVNEDLYLEFIIAVENIVLLIILLTTVSFFILLYLVTYGYIKRIGVIAKNISEYSIGNDEQNIPKSEKNELSVIESQFHRMQKRNNELLLALNQRNEELLSHVEIQKKAELKILESQVNPHFLYNALDSINWLAITNNQVEISDMISNLANVLRYSISNIDEVVPFYEELSWLERYINMYIKRYNNSFSLELHIEDEVLSYPIHKMLIQPLVENVIFHAFDAKSVNSLIMIKAFEQNQEHWTIIIKDNGSGMNPSQLEKIMNNYNKNSELNPNHIGINNVINRVKMYYNENAFINVYSELGVGTEFHLSLPIIKGDNE